MPFALTSEPDGLPNLIPNHLVHLPLGDIQQESEADKVYIQAQVSYKCRYQTSRGYFQASLVEGNSSISAFFYNKMAKFCLSLSVGDTIAISKMRIEKNTRDYRDEHACDLMVNDDSFVWAYAKRPISLATQVPRKVIKYTYTNLADLQPNTTANVWGVVRHFSQVKLTQGSDFHLFLVVVDPSVFAVQGKLKCSLFARTAQGLPDVQHKGDIVRIHRLEVQEYNGELFGGNSPGISICVFDPALDGSMTPRTTSSSHTMTPENGNKLHELREWVDSLLQGDLDPPDPTIDSTMGDPSQNAPLYTTLSNIHASSYCNVICQVLKVKQKMSTATAVLPCHAHKPFSTLQEVQNHATASKFHVKAKVLELTPKPTEPRHFCQIYCRECHFLSPYSASLQRRINVKIPCPTPDCNSQLQVVFMLKLLLHDGQSSLQVGVWKEEAVRFLRDLSPSDVSQNRASFDLVLPSLHQLCPTPTQVFDAQRPWMECCLMSFSNNDRKRYLIFDTQLD